MAFSRQLDADKAPLEPKGQEPTTWAGRLIGASSTLSQFRSRSRDLRVHPNCATKGEKWRKHSYHIPSVPYRRQVVKIFCEIRLSSRQDSRPCCRQTALNGYPAPFTISV